MDHTQAPSLLGFPGSDGILAALQPWLEDTAVSEIVLNRPQQIFVEKHGCFSEYHVPELNALTLSHFFQLLATENGQLLNDEKPLLSGSLQDGSRIQVVLPPTAQYPTFAIRRQSINDLTLSDYQNNSFYQNTVGFCLHAKAATQLHQSDQALLKLYRAKRWDALIRLAIQCKKNIVLSGGTSSGKTTYLNACLKEMPHHERLLILEDTREIKAPHPNQVQLLSSKGDQALAKVSMQDLVQCSLRLRPDRIIVGEVRGKEILDFVGACATGHSGSLTSIHAGNPRIAFMRMRQLYKQNNVPAMTDDDIQAELEEVVDIVVQLNRYEAPEGDLLRQVESIYFKYADLN